MGYMRRYKCPSCLKTTSVIRQTKRKNAILFKCKTCIKYFSIKISWINKKAILNDHLDGLSFRKLASKYHLSPMTTQRICEEELGKLPDNNKFTFMYCNRFSDTLATIERYRVELTGYRGIPDSPVTTNIIEGLNSHLESRLFSLRSFQSVAYAKLWFNGYVLKRRFTKFTDCRGKFRSLNGKRGVDLSKKVDVDLPTFF